MEKRRLEVQRIKALCFPLETTLSVGSQMQKDPREPKISKGSKCPNHNSQIAEKVSRSTGESQPQNPLSQEHGPDT